VLWCLYRDTFNNIVRESYCSTMDSYEISLVSEALKRCSFNAGEFIRRRSWWCFLYCWRRRSCCF
jgi:hypothetical protein